MKNKLESVPQQASFGSRKDTLPYSNSRHCSWLDRQAATVSSSKRGAGDWQVLPLGSGERALTSPLQDCQGLGETIEESNGKF
jgi:hypothetical protein